MVASRHGDPSASQACGQPASSERAV